jgi:hypothetical protein
MKINNFFILLIALAISVSCSKQRGFDPQITHNELFAHIDFLASDSLQGRYPGTPFDRVAAKYIKDVLEGSSLEFPVKNGYQFFEFVESQEYGEGNYLHFDSKTYDFNKDFKTYPFSSSDSITASIVFVGFGFTINCDSLEWDDYIAVNVAGKWAMILRGDPDYNQQNSLFASYSGDRHKAMVAKDHGAAGVILVSGKEFDAEDQLISQNQKSFDIGIPVIQIKRSLADKILKTNGFKILDLENKILKTRKPASIGIHSKLNVRTQVISRKNKTQNVIGIIKGTHPTLKNQYIVVGAHYDHLGMGGKNSSSRVPDTLAVHNGADDNASGVAALLEIGQKLADGKAQRSIVIVAFGSEEQGLLGSRYFVDYPIIPLDSIVAMINIDMLGRLSDERALQVSGVKTSLEAEELLTKINGNYNFKLSMAPQGYGPSDHASFYNKDIPVLFFSTGPHFDYHTPNDVIEKINFEGLLECSNFIYDIVVELANLPEMLTFQEAGPKTPVARHGSDLKVRFGIMPDVSGTSNDGLIVLAVNPNQPAHLAGISKGDMITAINGKEVRNINDYMYRLQELKPGTTVSVEIVHRGVIKVVIVQL